MTTTRPNKKCHRLALPGGELTFQLTLIFGDPAIHSVVHRNLFLAEGHDRIVWLYGARQRPLGRQLPEHRQLQLHHLLREYRHLCADTLEKDTEWTYQNIYAMQIGTNGRVYLSVQGLDQFPGSDVINYNRDACCFWKRTPPDHGRA